MRVWVVVSTLFLSAFCSADEDDATCSTCHTRQAEEFAASVHAKLDCRECHGGNASYALAADELKKHSASSGVKPTGFDHGTSFRGNPARAEVPDLCGACHADVERMNPYGLRTDQLARYWTSGHGKTLKSKGDARVAVCVDCHGAHEVVSSKEPDSKTHPLNIPDMCGACHADEALMADYDLPVAVVEEYRQSVHGELLLQQHDLGAPTCATCHGNHSAMPPGFATVGAVCGQCHAHTEAYFAETIHAEQEENKGCVQCHGGGEGRHFHMIERITNPAGLMIRRYERLLSSEPRPTPEQITEAIHPNPSPKDIITRALSTCSDCHDTLEEDESLPKLLALLDEIARAERYYVETARRLDQVGKGVLLVENQRFKFEDAKTHLIGLSPLQHTLDNARVAEKVAELNAVCDEVNADLTELERGLTWRRRALIPVWAFAVPFAGVLYVKYRQLKRTYVKPLPKR